MYSRGRPPKLRSIEPIIRGKKPTLRLPIHDIRYDKTGHWPEMQKKKKKKKKKLDVDYVIWHVEQHMKNAVFNFLCWNIEIVSTISTMYAMIVVSERICS